MFQLDTDTCWDRMHSCLHNLSLFHVSLESTRTSIIDHIPVFPTHSFLFFESQKAQIHDAIIFWSHFRFRLLRKIMDANLALPEHVRVSVHVHQDTVATQQRRTRYLFLYTPIRPKIDNVFYFFIFYLTVPLIQIFL